MEAEIDLRPYIEAVIQRWYWVVGTAVVAAVVAFLVSTLLPPNYEAVALVAITEPSQLLEFDVGFEAVTDITPRPLRAYPDIATSDEVLRDVLDLVRPDLAEDVTLSRFRDMVTAESGSDLSLIRLTAIHQDADMSAKIVNTWAQRFVDKANDVYGRSNGSQQVALEEQLDQVQGVLESGEEALVEFQARNRLEIIENELTALQETSADLLAERREMGALLVDIAGFLELLANENGTPVNLTDQFTALFLQMRAFQDGEESGAAGLTVQINPDATITTVNRDEQMAALVNLESILGGRLAAIDAEILAVEPQILSLQQQREEFTVEKNGLVRERDTAQDAYVVIARRVEEERVATQGETEGVRLASQAAVPEQAIGSGRLINTALAFVLGLLLPLFAIVAGAWWQGFRLAEPA